MEQQVLIKRPEVEQITRLSRSAIYAAMDAGSSPVRCASVAEP